MKKYICLIISVFSIFSTAQVAIGKNEVISNSVSLEFGEGHKGLILPWVDSTDPLTLAVDGTLIFDTSDFKVKYKRRNNWFDLSVDENGTADLSLQSEKVEKNDAKVVIGKDATTSNLPGILVLTDEDKAMILPKMELPHLNIKNPAAGMIAYDTLNKQLAVFNGQYWSFWKP